MVTNTPGVLDETTADTAFLLILAASRLASTAEADLRTGRWQGWGITQYMGRDVHGAILGLVGYGRIAAGGRANGRRASGCSWCITPRRPTGVPHYMDDLDELLDVRRHGLAAHPRGRRTPTTSSMPAASR